jgi:hypothetical protein
MEREGNPMKIKKAEKPLIEKIFTPEPSTPKPPEGGLNPSLQDPPLGRQGGENIEMKINLKVSEWYLMLHNCIMLRGIVHIAYKNLSIGFNQVRVK